MGELGEGETNVGSQEAIVALQGINGDGVKGDVGRIMERS